MRPNEERLPRRDAHEPFRDDQREQWHREDQHGHGHEDDDELHAAEATRYKHCRAASRRHYRHLRDFIDDLPVSTQGGFRIRAPTLPTSYLVFTTQAAGDGEVNFILPSNASLDSLYEEAQLTRTPT